MGESRKISMFKKIKNAMIAKKLLSGKENDDIKIPDAYYERVAQLENLKLVNETLNTDITLLAQRFYEDDVMPRVTGDFVAADFRILTLSSKDPHHRDFVKAASKCFDDIAELQRQFYIVLLDEMIVNLREWRAGEYSLVREQVNRLDRMILKRKDRDIENPRNFTEFEIKHRLRCQVEQQLNLTMKLLDRIDVAAYNHACIMMNLMSQQVKYHQGCEAIIKSTIEAVNVPRPRK